MRGPLEGGSKRTSEPPRPAYQRTSEKNDRSKEKQQRRETELMSIDAKEGIQPRPNAYVWRGQTQEGMRRKQMCILCVRWSDCKLRGISGNLFLSSR